MTSNIHPGSVFGPDCWQPDLGVLEDYQLLFNPMKGIASNPGIESEVTENSGETEASNDDSNRKMGC